MQTHDLIMCIFHNSLHVDKLSKVNSIIFSLSKLDHLKLLTRNVIEKLGLVGWAEKNT